MSLLPQNARILEYKILGHLGSGGFANTYLARDENLDKQVAIKEFFPRTLCERDESFSVKPIEGKEDQFASYLKLFVREAQTLARVEDPNIVRVLRYFEGLGSAYIIMEFVEGRHLGEFLSGGSEVDDEQVRNCLVGILSGLNTLHGNGIIHGDIKPKNILVKDDGTPVLIDFGASVLYQGEDDALGGDVFLTQGYAAPEQFSSDAAPDHRIDIYALGAVFYEIVTQQKYRPGDGDTPDTILGYGKFYRQKFLQTIANALPADPDDRYQTAQDWLNDLTLSGPQKLVLGLKRHKFLVAFLLLLIGASAWSTNFIIVNEVDTKNWQYKIHYSQSEIDDQINLAASGAEKIATARRFLQRYMDEYAQHLTRIDAKTLVSGRVNMATLNSVIEEIDDSVKKLSNAETQIESLRQKYYFDDIPPVIEDADRIVRSLEDRFQRYSRQLFSAVLESTIISEGALRNIPVDTGQLAALINQIETLKTPIAIENISPRVRPVADEFLRQQIEKETRKETLKYRSGVIEDIQAMARKYRGWTGSNRFDPLIDRVSRSADRRQIAEMRSEADRIEQDVVAQRNREVRNRKRQKIAALEKATARAISAQMIKVAGDSFEMGSTKQGYARPPHLVQVGDFYLAKNEVTVSQWNACVAAGKCPSVSGQTAANRPVTNVSWDDAQKFIGWLNGQKPRFRFRLPSEAEWEYTVRKHGYRIGELRSGLSAITVNNTNNLGVNSLIGNALEWLDDCWHGGYIGAPKDGSSWNEGLQCHRRVVRGGNWGGKYTLTERNAHFFRPFGVKKTVRDSRIGFRLAGDRR